jgi:hypothetical protein
MKSTGDWSIDHPGQDIDPSESEFLEDIAAANGFSSVVDFNDSIKDQEDDYDYENSCFLVPCLECGEVRVPEDEIYCSTCYNRLDKEGFFDPCL